MPEIEAEFDKENEKVNGENEKGKFNGQKEKGKFNGAKDEETVIITELSNGSEPPHSKKQVKVSRQLF